MYKAIWTIGFTLVCLSILAAASSEETSRRETGEGFDSQSPFEIEKARKEIEALFKDAIEPRSLSKISRKVVLDKYQHLDPNKLIPTDLLESAVLFLDKNSDKFPNRNYMAIVNFGPRSDKPRLFVVDMITGTVEKFFTSHGQGSDKNNDGFAESFGNVVNSGKSSLGFVRTAEVYSGKYKRSIRLDGLSTTNTKIRERAIVLHGWDDVHEKPIIQGLSWGCLALDWAIKDAVIDKIKEGSLLYVGVSGK